MENPKITKKALLQIKRDGNRLTKKVVNVILDNRTTEEMTEFIREVQRYGCESGAVGELIYYSDTSRFFGKYHQEITALLAETIAETGLQHGELFGDKWDVTDPFVQDVYNQNLLTWFGFEETISRIATELGIE